MSELDSLLSRCSHGDPCAWEALVRRYQTRVYGYALHYLRDHEEARDAAQEIFIKMYQNLDDVRDGRTFVPWMLRLARNCCIDRIRTRKVRPFDFAAEAHRETADRASLQASPEDALIETARRALLYRALAKLNASNRQIVLLKDIEQLHLADISTRLGLPLGTVKSRCNRARVELAKAVRSLAAAAEVNP